MGDFTSLINNLVVGATGSLIASFIFLEYTKRKDKQGDKERYGKAEGTYIGYGTTTENGTTINDKSPISDVKIIHLGGNLLQLNLKEKNNKHEWEGLISMQSNHFGTIVWRYTILNDEKPPSSEHRFGLKKFVFYPRDNKKVAYIKGELDSGYFTEILMES